MEYGIRNIPAILVFRDGKIADRIIGATTEGAIRNKIAETYEG